MQENVLKLDGQDLFSGVDLMSLLRLRNRGGKLRAAKRAAEMTWGKRVSDGENAYPTWGNLQDLSSSTSSETSSETETHSTYLKLMQQRGVG